MSTVTSYLKFGKLKIKINDILHLNINTVKLAGIYSWNMGDKDFFIEFTFDDATITAEYDNKDLWVAILNELEKQL